MNEVKLFIPVIARFDKEDKTWAWLTMIFPSKEAMENDEVMKKTNPENHLATIEKTIDYEDFGNDSFQLSSYIECIIPKEIDGYKCPRTDCGTPNIYTFISKDFD